MRNRVQIIAIEEKGIRVVPLITDACINCGKASCAKRGKAFYVSNPNNIPVQTGAVVKITSSAGIQALQAVFSLLFPIAAAVLGYVLIPGTEPFRAACVTGCFLAAAGIVFFVTHFLPPVKSEIAGII